MIDERGRLFGFINIVDLAVILLVVLLAAGFLYRGQATEITAEPHMVRIEVVANNIFPGVEESLQVGDRLVAAGAITGAEITEMEVKEANWVTTDAEGKMHLETNPFRNDIHLTIEGPSTQIGPSQINFAGQEVRAGIEDFYVKTQVVEVKGNIVSVEVLE
ncbi:hypothetical protein SYNTR_1888 [Candidatus Syntrophocurvum alkaliphilum]|uniref:DUF4330 domain-containing protein n=1 Tax=Candidatus Syntrophocurvum alkaliphilum TaxID=2293317 RepID=A0A6I6DD35_9FIRM|nr:DUF4330 domain-containing protein [Candidatus Syntrophocurvum alkaliphilum]QGU00482.1 hypothetical protein SYNTR_1888 [Candidatus Syntrophocurvum alkaliphilum]